MRAIHWKSQLCELRNVALTALVDLIRVGIVFVLVRRSWTILGGAKRSNKVAGAIERTVCSKRSVKSKSERQPWTAGPNALSHEEAMRAY